MRTIQKIRKNASGCHAPFVAHDELRHLLAIAETEHEMVINHNGLELEEILKRKYAVYCAARAAGLFGDPAAPSIGAFDDPPQSREIFPPQVEVGKPIPAPAPDATMLAYKEESIQLLCAAHQIAERRGHNVGWYRFAASIKKCLEKVGINNPATARCYHE